MRKAAWTTCRTQRFDLKALDESATPGKRSRNRKLTHYPRLARRRWKEYDSKLYGSYKGVHPDCRADRHTRGFALCESIGYARTVSAVLSNAQ